MKVGYNMHKFEDIWAIMGENAILGKEKSYNLYNELIGTASVPGCMAEIGVYKGQTAKLMHLTLPEKVLHLYDTFTGIVESDPLVDFHKNGDFNDTSLESVQNLVGFDEVFYHIGMFPDVFKELKEVFSFVHSDTDTYFGTKATLDYILPRLSVGGKLIFDDYNWDSCPGVKKALDEFMETNVKSIKITVYQHQFVIKML